MQVSLYTTDLSFIDWLHTLVTTGSQAQHECVCPSVSLQSCNVHLWFRPSIHPSEWSDLLKAKCSTVPSIAQYIFHLGRSKCGSP